MLPGWLGSVLSGTLGTSVAPVVVTDDQTLSYRDEKRTANTIGNYKNLLQNRDSLPEVTTKHFYWCSLYYRPFNFIACYVILKNSFQSY